MVRGLAAAAAAAAIAGGAVVWPTGLPKTICCKIVNRSRM